MGSDAPQTREAKRLAHFFRQLQKEENMSYRTIAKELGLTNSYISKICNGDRYGFGTEIIRSIKEKYKIDPRYFFDDYDGLVDYHRYVLDGKIEASQAILAKLLEYQEDLEDRMKNVEKLIDSKKSLKK